MRFSPGRAALAAAPTFVLTAVLASPAHGQHEHHHDGHEGHAMTGAAGPEDLLDLERRRNASGTAWQPETVPHTGVHLGAAGWQLMLHGVLFAGYDKQWGPRGDRAALGIGWVMGMAERRVADAGALSARVMLSPEPATVRDGGYPLYLQTGETWQGQPLRDHQHPHDLFMELALAYTHRLADNFGLQLYAAPAGEPALGPVAFPHRISAAYDPLAAIGHHWQDSTHISFGVLTAGLFTRWFKLEGSWFNGSEPDENRWDLDLEKPNAYSARLSVNPTPTLSAQVSYGHLPSHGTGAHAHGSTQRITASVAQHQPYPDGGHVSWLAVYGRNQGHHGGANAFLLEGSLGLGARNVLFARAELVQKSGAELVLTPALDDQLFDVSLLAAGYVRNFDALGPVIPGLGARGAINLVPADLEPFYGSRTVWGGMIYLRFALVGARVAPAAAEARSRSPRRS
jgi:hypothetical protein